MSQVRALFKKILLKDGKSELPTSGKLYILLSSEKPGAHWEMYSDDKTILEGIAQQVKFKHPNKGWVSPRVATVKKPLVDEKQGTDSIGDKKFHLWITFNQAKIFLCSSDKEYDSVVQELIKEKAIWPDDGFDKKMKTIEIDFSKMDLSVEEESIDNVEESTEEERTRFWKKGNKKNSTKGGQELIDFSQINENPLPHAVKKIEPVPEKKKNLFTWISDSAKSVMGSVILPSNKPSSQPKPSPRVEDIELEEMPSTTARIMPVLGLSGVKSEVSTENLPPVLSSKSAPVSVRHLAEPKIENDSVVSAPTPLSSPQLFQSSSAISLLASLQALKSQLNELQLLLNKMSVIMPELAAIDTKIETARQEREQKVSTTYRKT